MVNEMVAVQMRHLMGETNQDFKHQSMIEAFYNSSTTKQLLLLQLISTSLLRRILNMQRHLQKI